MAWYRAGTVSVTNGSAVVTGANTDFVSNTQIGEAFVGPDGLTYEIAQVVSATQIALADNYRGASGAGQGYKIQPTSSFARDLALGAAQLLNTFAAVRDGIGQGFIADGSFAAPGIRFAADQDTGIYRNAANAAVLVAGGSASFAWSASALQAFKPFAPVSSAGAAGEFTRTDAASACIRITAGFPSASIVEMNSGVNGVSNDGFDFRLGGVSRYVVDAAGNVLIGDTAGVSHKVRKNGAQGVQSFEIFASAAFFNADGGGYNNAAAAMIVTKNTTTGRSGNVAGTWNMSGADYAEYMTKADGCGTIAAGDVCGVDIAGKLTRQWGAAISFVVKSTDPSLVGGDVWAAHLGPRPEAPGSAPIAPGAAPTMPDDDAPEALAAWRDAVGAHKALVMAYPAEHAAWTSAQAQYETALDAWEEALETARQCVDRIAFCGQVPVNVTGDFAVGDYIVAVANGSGIKAVAVAEADITFDQYRRRIGKVWTVRDGRAWVDVQHG